ncbi:MAG: VCBS repeat-containing protein [Bryobacteraceae bacterium]
MRVYATALALLLTTVLSAAAQSVPTFLAPEVYPVPGASMVAVGDFNRDGLPDIVTANGLLGISLLLRNVDATFQPAQGLVVLGPNHPSYNYVVVGDFNNDRKLDIAVGKGDSTFTVFLGNGDSTFQPAIDTPVSSILRWPPRTSTVTANWTWL